MPIEHYSNYVKKTKKIRKQQFILHFRRIYIIYKMKVCHPAHYKKDKYELKNANQESYKALIKISRQVLKECDFHFRLNYWIIKHKLYRKEE